MAKLGPFCSKDNCLLVRGVLERLITHLSNRSLHVCGLGGLPLVEFPCVVRVDVWLVEGVGGLGVARTLEEMERCGRSRRNTGWHICLAAQTAVVVIYVVEKGVMSGDIMMASMNFVVKPLELIDLFCFYFLMAVVFDSMDEKSGPV